MSRNSSLTSVLVLVDPSFLLNRLTVWFCPRGATTFLGKRVNIIHIDDGPGTSRIRTLFDPS